MLKFFRNIRQNLLAKGNTAKYLKYAIGEIVLVVIGILIALQINNWNEGRKEALAEQIYIKGLDEEFLFNKQLLKNSVDMNDRLLEDSAIFLQYTGPHATAISDSKIREMFGKIMGSSVGYEPNPGILEDLINSGNLNTITSSALRNALSVWKADLAKAKLQERKILIYRDNILDLFLEAGPLRTMLRTPLALMPAILNYPGKNF